MVFDPNYAKYYDLFNRAKDYTRECDFLEQVFRKFGKIKTILDLGCGTGLHDKALALRGYKITGLDLSEDMMKIARQRCPNLNFVVGNMSNFNLNEKFDAVISMFASIGYLTENSQVESFMKSVKNHLNKTGLLIIDCWNGLGVMNELPSSRERILEVDNLKIVRKSFPDLDAKNHLNNVKFNIKVFEQERLIKEYNESHKVRFFFPLELKKYLEEDGFEILQICPSFDINQELSEKHWNMVLICRLK